MEELTVGTRVEHPRYGEGIVSKDNITAYEIFFERGGKIEITKRNTDLKVLNLNQTGAKSGLSIRDFEKVMTYVLDQYGALSEIVPLGEKWQGGTLLMQPANPALQPKEIPIETFFHKIVMLRDRLRVLEQNINSSNVLSDEEKVNLQQYITRVYGSLTTFNVLFSEKDHYFVGVKSK
ncbi:hypothetical protein INQ51_13260 [Maribellus sp. CM-23]|uniref:Uncharacterized protein n=1 Tax=Maribellus luteus TaxID=2305463 RepID=A0A399T306_9BACT|nr:MULTISPECIES: hypothetical protein [Maribellus]MCE4565279.1 hypothetical protein [Maribellus sp. CM-23]RIJ50736.1 hypothetical protein D1614_02065 [Maribellus luteus]